MKNILSVLLLITQVFIHQSLRAQIPSYVPTNGLVGWWPFNGNANDESGNGNNGTVNGATLKTDRFGKVNSSYSFNGTINFISVPNPSGISFSNGVSISVWAKIDGLNTNTNCDLGCAQFLVSKANDRSSGHFKVAFSQSKIAGDGQKFSGMINQFLDGGSVNTGNAFPYPQTSWTHVVVTFNNSQIRIFTNGTLNGTKSYAKPLINTTNPIYFGKHELASYPYFVNGQLDDIGIWNRALTEPEIKALYQGQFLTLNLKLFLQGYCQNPGSTTPMDNNGNGGCLFVTGKSTNSADVDTVNVTLVNSALNEVASAKGILKTNGSLAVSFAANPNLVLGNQYYLKIKHRNSVETWSASPVTLNSVTNYDLTTASNKAYGNNLVEVSPGLWAIYSGDIADASLGIGKQDGVIETSDYSEMENAAYQVLTGYQVQDITGDGVVETSDYSLMENNAYQVVSAKKP